MIGINRPRTSSVAAWSEIVGAETAAHSTPVGIEEGVLTVRCDSTAWAQQLRTIPPDAQRAMAKRAGSTVVEVNGSHAVYVSQPKAVASLIAKAASGVAVATR